MEFNTLIRRRGSVKARLTNFTNFLLPINEQFEQNANISNDVLMELKNRVESLHTIIEDFDSLQNQIEEIAEENILENQYLERNEFLDKYHKHLAMSGKILNKYSKLLNEISGSESQSQGGNNNNLCNIKLPTIDLPKFRGQPHEWLCFKDTFESLINSNDSINDIQKFHYLRASLQGPSLKIIESLEFTGPNYSIAWDTLCNRFNNNRVLITNHLKALFNLPVITKESPYKLRNLIDDVYKHLRALKSMQLPVDHWDCIVTYLISIRLDRNTALEWEKIKGASEDMPTLMEMTDFLKNQADLLESIDSSFKIAKPMSSTKNYFSADSPSSKFLNKCYYCQKSNHKIYKCFDFLKLNVAERIEKVSELKLCKVCLCTGHKEDQCRSNKCSLCRLSHNRLLHASAGNNSNIHDEQNVTTSMAAHSNRYVLLSTVRVQISDETGNSYACTALLDSGSQSCFISNRMAEKLKIPQKSFSMSINGLNHTSSNATKRCNVTVKSMYNNFKLHLPCLIIEQITENLPSEHIDITSWNLPQNINLANPDFNDPTEIDLLIGGAQFWSVIKPTRISLGKNLPVLQDSSFGYIVAGPLESLSLKSHCLVATQNSNDLLNESLIRFWNIEECSDVKLESKDDILCEQFFVNTFSRNAEGRFVVRIPFKDELNKLGDSLNLAKRRFFQLETRLKNNPNLRNEYHCFMKEYITLDHMEFESDLHHYNNQEPSYFLCHHPVVKIESISCKLRVVFNGSAATDSGYSLNDIQHIGPAIQNDIFEILLSFRQHPFVVTSDISKMYRQILVHPDDRNMQKILWRFDPNSNINIYRLKTITYGTGSAPYMAMRCLNQLASDFKNEYPQASDIIKNKFYVDDLIVSFKDENEAIKTCNEIAHILNTGCLPLRKWRSNSLTILDSLKHDDDPLSVLTFGDKDIKTLGIQWSCQNDILFFHINTYQDPGTYTKRHITSEIFKIYDPLGLISPCIIIAKILLQKLWSLQIDWDIEIPQKLIKRWLQFRRELSELNNLKIERHVLLSNLIELQLHGFCDASSSAYSACIYLRSINSDGVKTSLLCSKTKVAPLRPHTIPRLELMAAVLLAKLVQKVRVSFEYDCQHFLWSDSQVTLHWIHTEPHKLQQFVANRVNKVQELSVNCHWNYVNTKENPADLASRGVMPSQICNSSEINYLWLHGPRWLENFDSVNYNYVFFPKLTEIPELRKVKEYTLTAIINYDIFNRYSNLHRLQRVTAYILRFKNNTLSRVKNNVKFSGPLSVDELNTALMCLIKMSQRESFKDDYEFIETENMNKINPKLRKLTLFIDNFGIIRLRGRLKHSALNPETKHPILLDGKHNFTKLLFLQEHNRLFHTGSQLLLNTIRTKYWPIGGLSLAKRVTRQCVVCFKYRPRYSNVIMGDLPESRVTKLSPFSVTGVDFAGPYMLKDRKGKGYKISKAYLCLFVCFAVKAVHLEVVSDLTTENFISCLRRFSARRGYPSEIWSDNGTNFIGASKELHTLKSFLDTSQDKIFEFCSQFNMKWNFIPPRSPHFGGLWESNIKTVKSHLTKVIGETILTYEEFQTLVVQVEAVVNSRPLHPMSSDPSDLQPITPSHFLIGKPLVMPPDPLLSHVPVSRLSRFQLIQQLSQSFWARWQRDYLCCLQQRNKWQSDTTKFTVGTMVLVKSEILPPTQWPLGRITEVHPGSDGCVRVVSVKTNRGVFKRSIVKLCALPIDSEK